MSESRTIHARPEVIEAMSAIWRLLGTLRVEAAFVGAAATSAWLDRPIDATSVDLVAMLSPDGVHQVPMMAGNRGFLVERDTVEAARELDLVPLGYPTGGGTIRVHVLLASNALYARMIREAVDARLSEESVRVVNAEDLALLLLMTESDESEHQLRELREKQREAFDLARFNDKLASIGLASKRISE